MNQANQYWRLSKESIATLNRMIGAHVALRGACHEVRFSDGDMSAELFDLELFAYEPHQTRRVALSTEWHTSPKGIDWHEIHAENADNNKKSSKLTTINVCEHAPLSQVEATTIDFEFETETLSIDTALNLVFEDGSAMNLTTDFDSILGAFVVSSGRYDAVRIEWEGLTQSVRTLQTDKPI